MKMIAEDWEFLQIQVREREGGREEGTGRGRGGLRGRLREIEGGRGSKRLKD